MLREYAFTPQVFDAEANADDPDWPNHLRLVGMMLGVPSSPTPVVVAGLYSEGGHSGWETQARQCLETIAKESPARALVLDLLTRMIRLQVPRAPEGDWPGDDEPPWIREACDSHEREPLHRLVAVDPSHADGGVRAVPLAAAGAPGFWDGCIAACNPSGSMAEQAAVLTTLIGCSEFLEFVFPYEPEHDFACELINIAKSARPLNGPRVIRVHCRNVPNPDARAAFLRRKLGSLSAGMSVTWCFWPKERLRERLILGGRLTTAADGAKLRSVRWGVSLTHVPWADDDQHPQPPQWSLIPPPVSRDHLDRLSDGCASATVTCK